MALIYSLDSSPFPEASPVAAERVRQNFARRSNLEYGGVSGGSGV